MKIGIIIIQLFLQWSVIGQSKVIEVLVIDSLSKEPLIFATVYDITNDILYQSNLDGRFQITMNGGETIKLCTNYTGYDRQLKTVMSDLDIVIIRVKGGIPGGVQDYFAQQEYYTKNGVYVDSMQHLFNQFDRRIQGLPPYNLINVVKQERN